MHDIGQIPVLLRAFVMCHKDIGSDAESDEQLAEQIDEAAGGAYRRKRIAPGKTPDDDDIGRIEQKLKLRREHQGDIVG